MSGQTTTGAATLSASSGETEFGTHHLRPGLKIRSVRGGAVVLLGQGLRFFLQLGSTAILARLLTPGDFGLLGMVAAITGFLLVFGDLGLSAATIQREDVTHDQVSNLFWVNLAFGGALMLLTAAIAPAIAWFYGDTRLTAITLVCAFGFLLGGLTVQHQALLRRQMRFLSLAVIDVASLLIGVSAAVLLAWRGAGYWSLVCLQLASQSAIAAGVWIACGWRPGLPARHSGVRSMLSFGGNLTAFGVVNYFSRNLDNVLIGWRLGAYQLGLYSKAYQLLLLPIGQVVGPISGVAVPALSRLQNDPVRFRNFYLKAVSFVAYATIPAMIPAAVLSDQIIGLVLGPQWLQASLLFKILVVAAIWQPVASTVGWLYVALNRTERMARWGFMSAPVIVLSFLVGLPWGARGVAACYAVAMTLMWYPSVLYAVHASPVSGRDVVAAMFRPLAISVLLGGAAYGCHAVLGPLSDVWLLIAFLGAAAVAVACAAILWRSLRSDLGDMLATAQLILGRQASSAASL